MVKVCGITRACDAMAAIAAGAQALGFNFHPGSPRYVTVERAAEMVAALPPGYLRVGVFVNPSTEVILDALERVPLDVVQIHGVSVPTLPVGTRIWRAITPAPEPPATEAGAEAYLLDTPSDKFGGSGIPFSWTIAAGFPARAILAGGLHPSNVAEAIRAARPWGVDACSRLESSPGHKDPALVHAFVQAALTAI